MRIILKNILKLSNFSRIGLLFLIYPACYVTASEEVVLRQYGYGSLYWGDKVHKKPAIYPLLESNWYITDDTTASDITPFYEISDAASKRVQVQTGINLHLSIKQKSGNILATVKMTNNSRQSYFVHKRNLPRVYSRSSAYSDYCSKMFLITTESIRLDYLGALCWHYDNIDRESWVKIPAGEILNFTTKLDRVYAFPAGKRRYNIGTLEYSIVNDHWFVKQNINSLLFSILNWKYSCKIDKSKIPLLDWKDLCESEREDKGIESFLFQLDIYERDNNTDGFLLRSNQVVTEIDGDKIKPFDYGKITR